MCPHKSQQFYNLGTFFYIDYIMTLPKYDPCIDLTGAKKRLKLLRLCL